VSGTFQVVNNSQNAVIVGASIVNADSRLGATISVSPSTAINYGSSATVTLRIKPNASMAVGTYMVQVQVSGTTSGYSGIVTTNIPVSVTK
jgi:hypothetical protein